MLDALARLGYLVAMGECPTKGRLGVCRVPTDRPAYETCALCHLGAREREAADELAYDAQTIVTDMLKARLTATEQR